MCFRDIQKSQICRHWILGDIRPCEAHQKKLTTPKPWYKKLAGAVPEPKHCGTLKSYELPGFYPNLCPDCMEDRVTSPPSSSKNSISSDDTPLQMPGPAQSKLAQTYGVGPHDPKYDVDLIEKQEYDLEKRLAAIDEDSARKQLAAEEASRRRPSRYQQSVSTFDTQTQSQPQQGRPPSSESRANLRGTDFRQAPPGYREGQRSRNVENSGSYTPSRVAQPPPSRTGMYRDGVDREVVEDYEEYKSKKLEPTYAALRAPRQNMEGKPRKSDEVLNNLTAQLSRQDLGRGPAAHQQHPRQMSRKAEPDPFYHGEHPNVAYARHSAEQDYQRRKPRERGLVDPSTVPVDTSWQDRTYSGQTVGPAWTKLTKELNPEGDHPAQWTEQDVTLPRTSAVPSPLSVKKTPEGVQRTVSQPPSYPARSTNQEQQYGGGRPDTPRPVTSQGSNESRSQQPRSHQHQSYGEYETRYQSRSQQHHSQQHQSYGAQPSSYDARPTSQESQYGGGRPGTPDPRHQSESRSRHGNGGDGGNYVPYRPGRRPTPTPVNPPPERNAASTHGNDGGGGNYLPYRPPERNAVSTGSAARPQGVPRYLEPPDPLGPPNDQPYCRHVQEHYQAVEREMAASESLKSKKAGDSRA